MKTNYENFLRSRDLLDNGFAYHELVSRWPSYRKRLPPQDLWYRMPPTLLLAHRLRERMIAKGAKGLRVVAAYRPLGGASRSQHKKNAALDLDLLKSDRVLAGTFYQEAARLFSEFAPKYRMGLGFYGWGDGRQGLRVHIDTGYFVRSWWGNRRSPVWRMIEEMGMEDPRR